MAEEQTSPHPGGRPTKYRTDMATQATKLCRLGATDKDLADFFDVTEQTINNWKHDFPEFFESIKKGKLDSDAEVADKLYQRATGFEWDEQEAIKTKTVTYENGKRVKEEEEIHLVSVHKVIAPDPTSAIFWLKNRQPDKWRDKQEVGVTVTNLPLPEQDKTILDDYVGEKAN